ncbi:SAM-dependent methyltransferase [Chitinophaga caeni]|uniref:SAM-dependent methyltransferase n=1 Tax=Chitinophaga caeni TaxID=2029983 RepID=A0A291QQ13_9BACT|nr:class I SAM-dependent methyltransferase [Chitinophaga caeni]ATL46021.1 SAM-dependent methyltransferase [Chitinophaga caeni]
MENKTHWEQIYQSKSDEEVSWTQASPVTSIRLIQELNLSPLDPVIDIGAGNSRLAEQLLQLGYKDITVLDISGAAIEKSKARLGEAAGKINWIVTDILNFQPKRRYALWHDRATFHFLTEPSLQEKYIQIANSCVDKAAVIATFSKNGPAKCSGLKVQQYDAASLSQAWQAYFPKASCFTEEHITPFNTRQEFLFCKFERI